MSRTHIFVSLSLLVTEQLQNSITKNALIKMKGIANVLQGKLEISDLEFDEFTN